MIDPPRPAGRVPFRNRIGGLLAFDGRCGIIGDELALEALDQTLASRTIIAGCLVHHSDRGVRYACGDYIGRLNAHGIQPSVSRIACPWDKVQAESFMKTSK